MSRVFIFCPAYLASGGPELLHQLCYELRKLKYDAQMIYVGFDKNKQQVPVAERFKAYRNPYNICYEDTINNIAIIPETMYPLLKILKLSKKVFWWLSVDNYYNFFLNNFREKCNNKLDHNIDIQLIIKASEQNGNFFDHRVVHFVQSAYALKHCKKLGIDEKKIYYLSDYLNPIFIRKASNYSEIVRENIVLYNPKKGYQYTALLMQRAPHIKWISLFNMTPREMAQLLRRAKVYIDFGEHPGKDRIPREAAISGCCILTSLRGAAAFEEDVPIPQEFKFEDNVNNCDQILEKIEDIFAYYPKYSKSFEKYRECIRNEQVRFKMDTARIFAELVTD
ncbi:hypothetical protein [Pectinatus haikarae]|uniref:hypothetical protein n=1 Tax=Pectinatus haikarae TaxID=349096 RepID=UPI0018C4F8D9|nr:hypothetical protein [Pectinatus haikarae]